MNTKKARTVYGFVGLGNMGGPMASNLAKGGFEVIVFDKALPASKPVTGCINVASLEELSTRADAVFLSLPDGDAVLAVIGDLLVPATRRLGALIDLSTIGIELSRRAYLRCAQAGIDFADCPVSGGRAGAVAGTIAMMWAGSESLLEQHRAALSAMAGKIFHVGEEAGQGQALKLLNNFLSATATAATAEALHFGQTQGLDLATMLHVINASTGQSYASSEKFVNRVATGTFDSGFATELMAKDLALYAQSLSSAKTQGRIGALIEELWRETGEALPKSDHTEIFKYLGKRKAH